MYHDMQLANHRHLLAILLHETLSKQFSAALLEKNVRGC